MTIGQLAREISGGIEVVGGTVKCGGNTRVVGENAKWFMRNKYITLEFISESKSPSERTLLKIIGLKLPLAFDRRIAQYDDENTIPGKTSAEINETLHSKALMILQERLDEPIPTTIKRLVEEYEVHSPLIWTLSELVRFLAFTHKKRTNTSSKIKVSPEMSLMVEQIWRGKNYFNYVINKDDAPTNVSQLIVCILEHLEKTKPPRGSWRNPVLKKTPYPILTKDVRTEFEKKISIEKDKLQNKLKHKIMKGKDETAEYVMTILNMENIIIYWIRDIETYYADTAADISNILENVKKFFG